MLCGKLKKSIDFIQKMWYYIFKEREPKTSREADTVTYLIHERRATPMGC